MCCFTSNEEHHTSPSPQKVHSFCFDSWRGPFFTLRNNKSNNNVPMSEQSDFLVDLGVPSLLRSPRPLREVRIGGGWHVLREEPENQLAERLGGKGKRKSVGMSLCGGSRSESHKKSNDRCRSRCCFILFLRGGRFWRCGPFFVVFFSIMV